MIELNANDKGIDADIERLYLTEWNIPFRELKHTIDIVSDYVQPILPTLDRKKYLKWLIQKIDFSKIGFSDKAATLKETLKYCDAIHYVLEVALKNELESGIANFQNSISKLSEIEIAGIQAKLIQNLGNIKMFTSKNNKDESFSKRYVLLRKSIEQNGALNFSDYSIFIAHYNETIANYLERTISIVVNTLQQIPTSIAVKTLPKKQSLGFGITVKGAETKTEHETIEIKPLLKAEAVQIVFEIIKDFFSTEHQKDLIQILETGKNASKHLIFLDNGNRLADAFKQLKKANAITGCEQKELESWIATNFKYRHRQLIKEYSLRYLNDIISTNKDKCQNPLLNVTIEKGTGEIKITKA